MLTGVAIVTLIALAAGLVLSQAARRLPATDDALVEHIDQLLPQTQCGQCGYPGCRPYARAIARGEAPINRCPPGGEATLVALSDLLGTESGPLDPSVTPTSTNRVALIDESACIGCARCLAVCPVDAIVGAHQFMHTVLSNECTGCELCLPPCPVDCIRMEARATGDGAPH